MTPTKGTPDQITKAQVDEAYTNNPGASLHSAAAAFGISYINMRALLKRHGIVAKPNTRNWTRKPANPLLSDRAWLAEQLKTKTYGQLAKELGTTRGNIGDRVKRYGLQSGRTDRVREGIAIRYPEGRRGAAASNWRGGRRELPRAVGGSYIYIYKPDHPNATREGYVMEHRLVMEGILGRLLTKDEVVHHKNSNRGDNRPENLEVTTRGEHARMHYAESARMSALESEVAALKARLALLDPDA